MQNPVDYRYSKDHEWVSVSGDVATIGITFHAQELLTDIVFVELPRIGQVVSQHGVLGVVESVKSVSDIYSPIKGEVIAVNQVLESSPELVNSASYTDGWIAKIKFDHLNEIEPLMTASEYEQFIQGDH